MLQGEYGQWGFWEWGECVLRNSTFGGDHERYSALKLGEEVIYAADHARCSKA